MSAVIAPSAAPASAFGRVWRIVRLLTVNPWTVVVWPALILAMIFAMNWAIWWLLFQNLDLEQRTNANEGIQFGGATMFIFVYMLVIAVQAVNLAFPLALGYGATRRAFTLGSALAFLGLSVLFATVMTLGGWLELVTDGWGVGGTFFRTFYFVTDAGWLAQWWIYFCWLVFFFFTGSAFAASYVRWKAVGLTAAFSIVGLLVLGAIAALTLGGGWPGFWEALVGLGTLGVATVALVPAVLAAGVGHLILRRATPRS